MGADAKRPVRPANLLRSRLRMSQIELLAAMDAAPTLTAAARAVNLTQPAASRLLNALEADLGVRLFERDGRSLAPTAAGQRLVQKAAAIIADLDRTQKEMEAINVGHIGVVSLGASVSSCYGLLPSTIQQLHREAPGISVSVHEGSMDELVRHLREGRIELLVGRFDEASTLEDIVIEQLHRPAAKVVCSPRHPILKASGLSWEKVLQEVWILPEGGTPMRNAVEAVFRMEGARPKSWIESSAIAANVSLLNRFDLIWVLSEDVARYFLGLGAIAVLDPLSIESPGAFALGYSRQRQLSYGAVRARDCLLAHDQRLPTTGPLPL